MAFDTLNIGRAAPVLVAGGDMPDSVLKQLASVYAAVNLLSASPTISLGGTYQLTVEHTMILKIDPSGDDRYVRLFQAVSDDQIHCFIIINGADAAETLTVQSYNGDNVATIAQSRARIFCLAGGSWTTLCMLTIAL